MLGLMITSNPGLTKVVMPPSASMAARVMAAGSGPCATARYAGVAAGEGSGLEAVSVGLASTCVASAEAVSDGTFPVVGLGGMVGLIPGVAVGAIVL